MRVQTLVAAVTAVAAVALVVSPAAAGKEMREEITGFLNRTLAQGYREQNVEKFLAAYAPDADIVHFIAGRTDREGLGKHLVWDFNFFNPLDASVKLLDAEETEDGLKVLIFLRTSTEVDGQDRHRGDRYWLLLRRGEEGWRIQRQSYREDFGVTELPHLGK